MANGVTLLTKDGTKVGNAIWYGSEQHEELGYFHLIETDFGNKMRLTIKEIHEWYSIGHMVDYDLWRADRLYLITKEPNDVG